MNDDDFAILDQQLSRLDDSRKLYWAAAALFWLGVLFAIPSYLAQTGHVPSLFPALLMTGGIVTYGIAYIKNRQN